MTKYLFINKIGVHNDTNILTLIIQQKYLIEILFTKYKSGQIKNLKNKIDWETTTTTGANIL